MWIYWSQSVGIGIFWFFKILTLKKLTTTEINIQSGITALSVIGKDTACNFYAAQDGCGCNNAQYRKERPWFYSEAQYLESKELATSVRKLES